MLNRKVIATQVTNLTDARYFAARGIDYLLFDLDKIALEQILEIKEWVEGPELLFLFSDSSISLLDEAIIKAKPAAISSKDQNVIREVKHLEGHVQLFDWVNEKEIILESLSYHLITNLADLYLINSDDGVLISGGSEQAVGLKAFDDLDGILDSLED